MVSKKRSIFLSCALLHLAKWVLAIATLPVTKGQDPAIKVVGGNATTIIVMSLRVVPCLLGLNDPPALHAIVEDVSAVTPIRAVFAPFSPVVSLLHASPRKAVQVRLVPAAAVEVQAISIVTLFVHLVPKTVTAVPAFAQLYL